MGSPCGGSAKPSVATRWPSIATPPTRTPCSTAWWSWSWGRPGWIPTDPDWAGQLRIFARDFRDVAIAHPHVVPLMVTRPLATPLALRPLGTLRPLESTLELLTRAGFSDVEALHVYRSFQGLLFGHVLNELQELVDNPEETDDLLRLGLHRLPIAEFPLLRGLASALTNYDGAAELEEGLDILIDGLRSKGPVPA